MCHLPSPSAPVLAPHLRTATHCIAHRPPPTTLSQPPCHLPLPQDQSGDLPKPDTLQSLATYLTLQKAKEEYGFDPAKYGMSERKAADVAQVGVRRAVHGG